MRLKKKVFFPHLFFFCRLHMYSGCSGGHGSVHSPCFLFLTCSVRYAILVFGGPQSTIEHATRDLEDHAAPRPEYPWPSSGELPGPELTAARPAARRLRHARRPDLKRRVPPEHDARKQARRTARLEHRSSQRAVQTKRRTKRKSNRERDRREREHRIQWQR